MTTTTCSTCGKDIFFRRHLRTGNRMPIDAEPVLDGNVILVGKDSYDILKRGDPTPPSEIERYRSHYQTCAQAEEWRSTKGRERA